MRPADDRQDDPQDDQRGAPSGASAHRDSLSLTDPGTVRGAGGVVFDASGRVLVLLHANGDRVFPKGHLEGSETPLQAALREVREESGIKAHCPEPHRSWTTAYRNSSGTQRQITWFACTTDDPTPALTEELFREAYFLPPAEALEQLTFAADRQLLARILEDAAQGTPPATSPPTENGAS